MNTDLHRSLLNFYGGNEEEIHPCWHPTLAGIRHPKPPKRKNSSKAHGDRVAHGKSFKTCIIRGQITSNAVYFHVGPRFWSG